MLDLKIKAEGVFVAVLERRMTPGQQMPMQGAAADTFDEAAERVRAAIAGGMFTRGWVASKGAMVEVTV
jgi:hypothetical protein